MNIFEKRKINLLKSKIEANKMSKHKQGKYSLFDTSFSDKILNKYMGYDSLKSTYDILSEWNEYCNLPYEVGVELDSLANKKTVMIHRTKLGVDGDSEGLEYNDTLFSIMNNGLKNYGHINSSGTVSGDFPELTLTMTPLKGITGYINLLGSYHSNDAIIIAAFPEELVDSTGKLVEGKSYSDIYDLSEEIPKVKTEYMVGVILKKNKGIDEFYTRNEVLEVLKESKTK